MLNTFIQVKNRRKIIVFLVKFTFLTASSEAVFYMEAGSTVCLPFSQSDRTNSDRFIKKGEEVLCTQFSGSKDTGTTYPVLSRPFNCTTNDSTISVCINGITNDVQGTFKYVIDSEKLENLTLIIASPPAVHTLNNSTAIEGTDFNKKCLYNVGKPPETNVYWTRQGSSFRHEGDVLSLTKIQRSSSGTYTCTAQNQYSSGNKGQSKQSMTIDVE
ncbi:uncharacterized protein LOC134279425, partial [Saccostrea cucullata]|uniref:uncharacterized protein LOC134279425 n=1 Tax=Saccostrea cuccullata TaxID=36930 RepID=UPI002ED31F7E